MFAKVYRHQLDAKNRMRIPAKFREELGEKFVVTIGSGGCLSVYSQEKSQEIKQQLSKVSSFDEKAMKTVRIMTFYTWDAEEDKQGRILIPQELRDYAKIQKDVIVIKTFDGFEIWSSEVWADYCKDINFSDLAATLKDLK